MTTPKASHTVPHPWRLPSLSAPLSPLDPGSVPPSRNPDFSSEGHPLCYICTPHSAEFLLPEGRGPQEPEEREEARGSRPGGQQCPLQKKALGKILLGEKVGPAC